ncbi:protein Njmu-R1-like isoform X2 [Girardinichthys multiradiatus]|uniref:protein Njmu-R1 isoform X2 n=1 Tax=Girardinichthys multiradiatus TaxID=208333 RepID=UPI001FAB8D11|nr:protein Njmu-R1 isoform X2 [Girardinichthys multiradiatus]XP_047214411.1 protein Njmu-R1-like isoform X2 [Girardinichthys multiradiatus]
MFSSQTSSFQDSIDVEERDDFDSEDITGYSQKIQLNCYYTIYLYQGTSLTLIDSSLPSEAEPELRTYISRRLSKGALLGGMGNIATVELSLPEQAVGCYCCLLEQERSPEQPDADGNGYVICFMGGSEKGLNLFRLELDKYVQGLHSSLQTPELQNLETEVRPYLSRWYEESVMHIHRVVQLFQSCIGFLLHAALSHTHVEVINSDERTKADVSRFIKAASLQGLSQQDTTTASLCKALSEDTQSDLIIDCSTCPPTLTNTMSNRFCDGWIQAFLNAAERCNPFLLRQILENFKLKAIQDMNSLKRFVRQAEMSHYALFRCCQFLQGCGNGDVLLQNARAEHSDLPEACNIIAVLDEFLREKAQA